MSNSYNEILNTDVIIVTGANTTEAHPVIGYRIKQAVKKGATLIVIDPRKIPLTNYASKWIALKPGTNIAFFNGLANIIYQQGWWNQSFVEQYTEDIEKWLESNQYYTPERVEEITGVTCEDLYYVARVYANANNAMILYAMGITQHSSGTDNVLSLANLTMLTGHIGRESTGLNPLRGQNNVQGACDMGGLPNVLPGYASINDDSQRRRFSEGWSTPLPDSTGLTLTEMYDEALNGNLKAMYIMGENPAVADPDSTFIRDAIGSLQFLIVQDIFMTETAQQANVVLPAVTFVEKNGTVTNTERCVQRVRQGIQPIGQAKADWEIIQLMARRFHAQWKFTDPEEIFEEIRLLVPQYHGIRYDRINQQGIQWPCPTLEHAGTPYLHKGGFARGKGRFTPIDYRVSGETADEEYPFILTTGRNLYHWHTGSMSRKVQGLEHILSEEHMQIHPEDAILYNLQENSKVQVTSRRGSVVTNLEITDMVPRGTLFMTFHFSETLTNTLTSSHRDPVSKIPEAKVTAVNIKKVSI